MSYPAKQRRNQEIVKIKENDPKKPWSEIGAIFGINRQTAYKIYNRYKKEALKNNPDSTEKKLDYSVST